MTTFPDPGTEFGTRVHRRLRDEIVVWMTTVGPDGTPQPNPVWFIVDGDALIVYNRPDALRLRHLGRNPRVAFNFDGDGTGDDIVVLVGTAEILDDYPPAHEQPAYREKYATRATAVSGSEEAFAAEYSVVVRVVIDKVRGF
jgi:PPOX class probable F420-dependent enzyme